MKSKGTDFDKGIGTKEFLTPIPRHPPHRRQVLECASPLALFESWIVESGGGPPHSKTLRVHQRLPNHAKRLDCVRFIAALAPDEPLAITAGHVPPESGAQAHAVQTLPRLLPDFTEMTAFCFTVIP
jgi:hypothetical protein